MKKLTFSGPTSSNSIDEILDDSILALKRCLALTDKNSRAVASDITGGEWIEGTEKSSFVATAVSDQRDFSEKIIHASANVTVIPAPVNRTDEPGCTMEGCCTQQNGSVAEAEIQTIVSSIQPKRIKIVEYEDEHQMDDIMRLITKVLSEPYSIYTYRYFIHNWPKLCLLAEDLNENKYVGAIVCKLDVRRENRRRGYIAMLAVDESYRKMGIGTRLVEKAIANMQRMGCDQVVLETEVTNTDALRLYGNLGFIREKRLFRYYLNGVDAYRLKLFLTPINASALLDPPVFRNSAQCVS